MSFDDTFKFRCHPGVACFTTCCADVTIYLTPFDVLRLSEALGVNSGDFLEGYTMVLSGPRPIIPLVVLKMREDKEGLPCPLVTSEGCTVYESRPWSCRMFPLDQVSKNEFKTITQSDFCKGLQEDFNRPVVEYLHEQGVDKSAVMDAAYQEITNHPSLDGMDVENPKVAQMVYLACYDLDRFKSFVLESSFLEKFEIADDRLESLKTDKVELLKLGFDWVKFGLFAEKTLKIRPGLAAEQGGE